MRAWKRRYQLEAPGSFASQDSLDGLLKQAPAVLPSLEQIGFQRVDNPVPDPLLDPQLIRNYHTQRDFPALDATSLTGPHLRFGTLSIRRLVEMAQDLNPIWMNQLIWREFFIQILFHFPHSATGSFRRDYDRIPWRNNAAEFERWCAGRTGFPIVDAGMRQLNETGYMHNRVRMITANFLTKLLLIDWRWGEQYFARKLLDYEMANNVGGWQWSSGSGCDAAPYFRIFNPDTQIEKFDPELKYIRRWIPEFDTADYPLPILDYRQARERAMSVYKSALKSAVTL
jgi:deoxyribodipyrimidine photo-lyase